MRNGTEKGNENVSGKFTTSFCNVRNESFYGNECVMIPMKNGNVNCNNGICKDNRRKGERDSHSQRRGQS